MKTHATVTLELKNYDEFADKLSRLNKLLAESAELIGELQSAALETEVTVEKPIETLKVEPSIIIDGNIKPTMNVGIGVDINNIITRGYGDNAHKLLDAAIDRTINSIRKAQEKNPDMLEHIDVEIKI